MDTKDEIIKKQDELMPLDKFIFWLNSMTTTELHKEFPGEFHILKASDSIQESVTNSLANDAILWIKVKEHAQKLRELCSRLEPDKPYSELQQLMDSISQWSDKQFGEHQRNPAIAYHLLKEVPELIEAIKTWQESGLTYKQLCFEYADCMMLLLDSATHSGLSADVLFKYVREKLEINKNRKWGKPDENGVVEHISVEPDKKSADFTDEDMNHAITGE